jgi:branched-chain amino acid transport system permease protein
LNSSFLIIQALNGLASASTLFITACGLSLVFGVTRIINFAHGSFYMLGAYFAATLIPVLVHWMSPTIGFWSGILISALAVGVVGVLFEVLVLRRVYRVSELYQLLVTFGAVLVVSDLVTMLFGRDDIFGMKAPNLQGTVEIL